MFKQYGTSVIFVPTVIGSRDIELLVRPEVSKPDYTQGVQLFGFTVPAFVTRRAETRVRLKDNQTLIIAGLILDDSRATVQKVPYLGDLPFLGALFRQTYWNHEKTELVMAVTPEIVQPASAWWRGGAADATARTADTRGSPDASAGEPRREPGRGFSRWPTSGSRRRQD